MKSVWKGSISFGLVSIGVQLFTAHEIDSLDFHLLHNKCLTPLKYHRWCSHCNKDVSWDSTVKGIKKPDESYLVFTPEELHELHPQKTEEITVVEFVDRHQIPIIYLNHHYYVRPSKQKDVAYALFIKALANLDKVAIGRFVMRDKEYTCAIQSEGDYLVLTTLFYAYEVRGLEDAAFTQKVALDPKELKLAQEIIQKLSVKTFDITQFKDTFAQEIKKLLKQKTKKGRARVVEEKMAKSKAKKSPLIDVLRNSLKTVRRPVAHAKKR